MRRALRVFSLCVASMAMIARATPAAAEKLRVLVIDGQNNHEWQKTTPVLVQILKESGRFNPTVITAPAAGQDNSKFRPKFSDYDVVMSNYNGDRWPKETEADFVEYLKNGGGFVSVHAADNAFATWPEYNRAIGLGGWYGRDDKSGPYVYYKDDKLVRDDSPGRCGSHGEQHEFVVRTRDAEHPIMKGVPSEWKHTKDELYDSLRGPAEDMVVLATAYSDPKTGGTGRDEPMLMAITFDKGRSFHTALGHADYSLRCAGFATTLLRGTEWAATGEVTIPVPEDFPTAEEASPRE